MFSGVKSFFKFIKDEITKGRQVYIEGRLRTRNWEDQEGVRHYTTEILARGIKLLGKKTDTESSIKEAPIDEEAPEDEDVPF